MTILPTLATIATIASPVATVGIVYWREVISGVRKDVRRDDATTSLAEKVADLSDAVEKTGRTVENASASIAANGALTLQLSTRADAADRRIDTLEGMRTAFTDHAATDRAEHKSMKESIERLERSNNELHASISRLIPADVLIQLGGGAGRPTHAGG